MSRANYHWLCEAIRRRVPLASLLKAQTDPEAAMWANIGVASKGDGRVGLGLINQDGTTWEEVATIVLNLLASAEVEAQRCREAVRAALRKKISHQVMTADRKAPEQLPDLHEGES